MIAIVIRFVMKEAVDIKSKYKILAETVDKLRKRSRFENAQMTNRVLHGDIASTADRTAIIQHEIET
jgi:hypothetical protein